MRPNSMPEYPNHVPAKKTPQRVFAIAYTATFVIGGLLGAAVAGGIVSASYEARIDHCVSALETSGEAMYAAGEAIEAAGNFDIYGLETASDTIANLNNDTFEQDITECGGTK